MKKTGKLCILKRYQNDGTVGIVCASNEEKYDERLRTLFRKEYLGKGYSLFFYKGNGEGVYEEVPGNDETILAEYEKGGVYYYNAPERFNSFKYAVSYPNSYCVVSVGEDGKPDKLICYATEEKYNETVEDVYQLDIRKKVIAY